MIVNGIDYCIIYLLTNMINGMIYFGQTWDDVVEGRMGKNGEKYITSPNIYNAIQEHKPENFQYTIMTLCRTQSLANELEDQFIEINHSRDPAIGYNIKGGGSPGKHHESTKVKISNTLKANIAQMTPEEIAKRAEPIAKWWLGKERGPQTEEHRAQVIQTLQPGSFIGHRHTDEAKAAMSAKNTGRQLDPEMVKARALKRRMPSTKEQDIIIAYQAGKTIEKIEDDFDTGRSSIYRILDRNNIPRSNNFTRWAGKTHSPETKTKMSESRKEIWAKRSG
jgi:group I intron endonuclease